MKTKSLLLVVVTFCSAFSYAQKPQLNEGFENFSLTTNPNTGLVTSSGVTWVRSGEDITLQIVENPNKSGINKSNKVLKINRAENNAITVANAFTWRGSTSLSYDFSKINKCSIEVKVLKNVAGKISMRFFADNNKNLVEIVSNEMPASTEWQVVRFDFTGRVQYPITPNAFILIQPEKNSATLASQTSALSIYVDDVKMIEN